MRKHLRALVGVVLSLCFVLPSNLAIQAQSDFNDSDAYFQRASRTGPEPNHSQKIEDLLKRMTLEEKVGQMTQLTIGMIVNG